MRFNFAIIWFSWPIDPLRYVKRILWVNGRVTFLRSLILIACGCRFTSIVTWHRVNINTQLESIYSTRTIKHTQLRNQAIHGYTIKLQQTSRCLVFMVLTKPLFSSDAASNEFMESVGYVNTVYTSSYMLGHIYIMSTIWNCNDNYNIASTAVFLQYTLKCQLMQTKSCANQIYFWVRNMCV